MKKTSGKKLVVGMIHTGASPGTPAGGAAVQSLVDAAVREARAGTSLPIYLGSGITPENLATFWPLADGFIVGSTLKHGGDWRNPPDRRRIRKLIAAASICGRG